MIFFLFSKESKSGKNKCFLFEGVKVGIRTKHPPDITPPAHFGIGGRNPPQVFYRVDIT